MSLHSLTEAILSGFIMKKQTVVDTSICIYVFNTMLFLKEVTMLFV